jgi:GNAT superfamily N-acetyltransferase
MPAPKPWTISHATPADAAALVALDQRNFPREDWFDRRLWRRILGEQAARGQMLTLVARQQDTVVGAIVGEFRARAGRLLVWSIAVDAPRRGAGLAQQLMAELVQRAPATYHQVGLDVRRGPRPGPNCQVGVELTRHASTPSDCAPSDKRGELPLWIGFGSSSACGNIASASRAPASRRLNGWH